LALDNTLGGIEPEHPGVTPRIEKPHRVTSTIYGCDIRAFVPVAKDTGIGKIANTWWTSVLPADDVIDLVGKPGALPGGTIVGNGLRRVVPSAMKSMISRYEGIAALLTIVAWTQDSAGAPVIAGNLNGKRFPDTDSRRSMSGGIGCGGWIWTTDLWVMSSPGVGN
jgi:hypothetical protein